MPLIPSPATINSFLNNRTMCWPLPVYPRCSLLCDTPVSTTVCSSRRFPLSSAISPFTSSHTRGTTRRILHRSCHSSKAREISVCLKQVCPSRTYFSPPPLHHPVRPSSFSTAPSLCPSRAHYSLESSSPCLVLILIPMCVGGAGRGCRIFLCSKSTVR